MRISVEDLFVGVAAGDAADDDAQGHARTLDRIAPIATPYSACLTALPAVRSAYSRWRCGLPFLARSRAYMLAARISPAEIPCRWHATLTNGPRP